MALPSLEKLLQEVRADGSLQVYLSAFRQIREGQFRGDSTRDRREVRIAVLSSFTAQNLEIYLDIHARLAGLSPVLYLAPFNQYNQEILNVASGLYAFEPEVVILALDIEDVLPEPLLKVARGAGDEVARDSETLLADLKRLLDTFRGRSRALVIVNNFSMPDSPLGVLDTRGGPGLAEIVGRLNIQLAEAFRSDRQVYVFDFNGFVSRVGRDRCYDPKLFSLSRMRLSYEVLPELSERYLGYVRALKGSSRKCLVLDLDNTLWGGIVGEDGPHGIQLGVAPPGNVYLAFQHCLLQLFQRGVLLAINSRNNYADAMEVIANHSAMLLREHHFASVQINWESKVANMKRIAEELSLPFDALAFFDDSPAERMLIRRALPDVLTIEVPGDPSLYVRAVQSLSVFEKLSITEEDRNRTKMYLEERGRRALQEQAASVEEYLTGLAMALDLHVLRPHTVQRIAQLTQKTNQFNMSTKRYSAAEIEALGSDLSTLVFGLSLRDVYGDMGIIGAAIVRMAGQVAEFDTFLLSCRALGRGVEEAFLVLVANRCRALGATELRGVVVRSDKNAPARDFFRRYGGRREGRNNSYEWRVDLAHGDLSVPVWFQLSGPGEAAESGPGAMRRGEKA